MWKLRVRAEAARAWASGPMPRGKESRPARECGPVHIGGGSGQYAARADTAAIRVTRVDDPYCNLCASNTEGDSANTRRGTGQNGPRARWLGRTGGLHGA